MSSADQAQGRSQAGRIPLGDRLTYPSSEGL